METLQRTANRGSISTGFDVDNSLKLEPDNSESMTRTPSGNGNLKTCTLSVWLKITELKNSSYFTGDYGGAANPWFYLGFFQNKIYFSTTAGVSGNGVIQTNRVFRDTSAWYHIVVACDTTQGTAANRVKIYVNGVQETSFGTANYPDQNDDLDIMAAKAQLIGGYNDGTDYRYAGYMSEFVGVDGQQLAPTSFGEFDDNTGIWIPKDVSGLTFGTNGFYLDFEDAANLGNDASGGTDFAETNIAADDQATDTPTNNFCTLGLQVRAGTSSEVGPSREGGTYMKQNGVNQQVGFFGTIGVTNGKWYWEVYVPSRSASYGLLDYIGLHSIKTIPIGAAATTGTSQCNYVLHTGDYNATVNGSNSAQNSAAGLPSYGTNGSGKTFGVAFNADDGKITFYESNTRIGNANIDIFDLHDDMGAGTFVLPFFQVYDNNLYVNFGGCAPWANPSGNTDANDFGNFAYSPPSGYYALCTKNLAEYG